MKKSQWVGAIACRVYTAGAMPCDTYAGAWFGFGDPVDDMLDCQGRPFDYLLLGHKYKWYIYM